MGEDQVKVGVRGRAKVSLAALAVEPSVWITTIAPLDPDTPRGPQIENSVLLTFDEAWELSEQIRALVGDD